MSGTDEGCPLFPTHSLCDFIALTYPITIRTRCLVYLRDCYAISRTDAGSATPSPMLLLVLTY
eukprot:2183325-Rhodomonas_salina.7